MHIKKMVLTNFMRVLDFGKFGGPDAKKNQKCALGRIFLKPYQKSTIIRVVFGLIFRAFVLLRTNFQRISFLNSHPR